MIWAAADPIFVPIISSLFNISEGSSECIEGIILGGIKGYFLGLFLHLVWKRENLVGLLLFVFYSQDL